MLKVAEIIGKNIAVDGEVDGNKLFDEIQKSYKKGEKIEISFEGINTVVSPFLNYSIGQFYREMPKGEWSDLDDNIIYIDLNDYDRDILLKKVIENAKFQVENPQKAKDIEKEILGLEDEWSHN